MKYRLNILTSLFCTVCSLVSLGEESKTTVYPLTDTTTATGEVRILSEITASISAAGVIGVSGPSIQFILSLTNRGDSEARIFDPLELFKVHMITLDKKSIALPMRNSKLLSESRDEAAKHAMPYPAPILFQQISRNGILSNRKEEVIAIQPHGTTEVKFSFDDVGMKIIAAAFPDGRRNESREVKLHVFVVLGNAAPPPRGGRVLASPWIPLTIPAPN